MKIETEEQLLVFLKSQKDALQTLKSSHDEFMRTSLTPEEYAECKRQTSEMKRRRIMEESGK